MVLRPLLFSLIFLVLLATAVQASGDPVLVASQISSVTVYADQAQVTRKGSVNLKAGLNLVSIDNLPLTLNQESLRVSGKGTGVARIAGLTVKPVFLERLQEQRIRELEEQVEVVQRKVATLEARRKGLSAQKAFLESIRVGWGERISKELGQGKPATGELNEAARFVGDGVGKVEESIYDTDAAKKPLQERINALKQELEQAKGNRSKEVRNVEVAIEAERPMSFDLELSYLVSDAHWIPTYDLRLNAEGTAAELTYRAQVWQLTGEAWPKVRLALSSARPEAGGAPPELFPWHVGFYQPPIPLPRPAAKRALTFGAAAPPEAQALEAVDGAAPRPAPARPVEAELAEGQTSVLFGVPQPVDIPADGSRTGTVIALATLPVSAEYQATPKLSPRVYLKSEVTNASNYPLLAGEVNIFNDAVFTGKSLLKTVAAGEKFDLFFGADDRVKVKREVNRVGKQGGILGNSRISYRVSVELDNFKKQPIRLSLLDQLPLAGNEEIKVKLEEEKPAPDERKPDGTLVWKLNLAPGEKKKLSYDIVIEYPKGRTLTGAE
ncbi:hypothetical protein GMST_27310 [Geomonas silvestris]|uniref:Mucoidy inhibitor MuiA family protein n=1 Tax=Geomonas silvestris TaxID=2740184 RepID=A0A6V8MKA3_9BACT|nr:mucoidy inhibitor MuiA family protein [Geomonas silvestris]GFO60406.1 hypothetical protein GMST_27310 [Geomonas silvestris]